MVLNLSEKNILNNKIDSNGISKQEIKFLAEKYLEILQAKKLQEEQKTELRKKCNE